jgi:hypothetical protein
MPMAILNTQPTNPNLLSQNKFRFTLQRAPNVVYFGMAATLPSITLESTEQASPFIQIPRPGNKIRYADFEFTFRVDEDLKNYIEVYQWMNDLGFPDDFSGYPRLEAGDGVFSDASLHLLLLSRTPT